MAEYKAAGRRTIWNGLRFALALISGKNIFICSSETPAGVSELLFHELGRGGKRQLQTLTGSPSQSNPSDLPALPKGEPLAIHANFTSLPRPLPLGEVDATNGSRRRGRGHLPPPQKSSPIGGAGTPLGVTERVGVPLRADFPRPGEDVAQRQKGESGIAQR